MRLGVPLSLLALSACAADGPPTLPGETPPGCTLAAPRSFLVDKIDPLVARPTDLSFPPDGEPDNDAIPYRFVHAGVEFRMEEALGAALDAHHILWILTIQRCLGSSFARIALRRGTAFIAALPLAKVALADEAFIWSVGTSDAAGTLNVALGMGTVPFAMPLDARANVEEPAWFQAHMVDIEARVTGSRVVGEIALTVETEVARPEVRAAIARTMNVARLDEPNCPPTCSNDALLMLQGLDVNHDRQFTADEIEQSGYLDAFGFFPTLDLLAPEHGELTFWPNRDGEAESIGNGFGFEAHEIETESALVTDSQRCQ